MRNKVWILCFEEMLDFGEQYEEYGLCGRYAGVPLFCGWSRMESGNKGQIFSEPLFKDV